jgi:hypothetical protein
MECEACLVVRIRRWVRRRLLGGVAMVIIKDRRTCRARRMVRRRILARLAAREVMARAIATTMMMIAVGEPGVNAVNAIVDRHRRVELSVSEGMMICRFKIERDFSASLPSDMAGWKPDPRAGTWFGPGYLEIRR